MPNSFDIIGIGSAFMDYILMVEESFLHDVPGEKGGMEPIDHKTMLSILAANGGHPAYVAGGSCTNVIKGLACLGQRCALAGTVGDDDAGKHLVESVQKLGITEFYTKLPVPTGHALCLVTPDGKRTCRTYLGASQEMKPEYLEIGMFEGVRLVHIEGYSLLYPEVTERAMRLAKEAKALVSFDMASFEIARGFKKHILELLEKYVDIVFANEDESLALTGFNPQATCDVLRNFCQVSVVLMGKDGCWVGQKEDSVYCQAFPVEPIDTTGAGDCFASGFLHGYLLGKRLEECARYGALAGRAVVQVVGAELPPATWKAMMP